MQQNGRLANNPAFARGREGDRVEAVVEALVTGSLDRPWVPGLSPVNGLQKGLTSTEEKTCTADEPSVLVQRGTQGCAGTYRACRP
jgi:hypothetical protein